jgi:hypothetical protein
MHLPRPQDPSHTRAVRTTGSAGAAAHPMVASGPPPFDDYLVVPLAVVGALMAVGYWVASWWGFFAPADAEKAALQQYGDTSRIQGLRVSGSIGWDDCAIVEMVNDQGSGARVVVVMSGRGWLMTRTTGPDVGFDFDDLHADHGGCLVLAHSVGPATNGAPDTN